LTEELHRLPALIAAQKISRQTLRRMISRCQQIMEMSDLDEMIRQRDRLVHQVMGEATGDVPGTMVSAAG
jgi:hypothetical protein